MSFPLSPINSTSVLPEHREPHGTDPQKSDKLLPSIGGHGDHPLYRQSSGNEQAIRSKLPGATGNGSAGKVAPKAAAGTGEPKSPEQVTKAFHDAATAPHIELLAGPTFKKEYSKTVGELVTFVVKGIDTMLDSKELKSAERLYERASRLNERYGRHLNTQPADTIASLAPHVHKTGQILFGAFAAIQRNKAVFNRIRAMLPRENKH